MTMTMTICGPHMHVITHVLILSVCKLMRIPIHVPFVQKSMMCMQHSSYSSCLLHKNVAMNIFNALGKASRKLRIGFAAFSETFCQRTDAKTGFGAHCEMAANVPDPDMIDYAA